MINDGPKHKLKGGLTVLGVILNAEGDPEDRWARKTPEGWVSPPEEIKPLLELLAPQVLWAPLFRRWEIHTPGGFRIHLPDSADADDWRAAMVSVTQWKKRHGE